MKILLFLFFVISVSSSFATNYYFSTTSGNDGRTPVEAKNPSTPWKTIDKLNTFFSSLQPGDSVLFKRGETFYGSIAVNKSGAANAPIFIGSYGNGNKPVITSLVPVTNWIAKGNGIWESYNPSLGTTINIVLLNGIEYEMGRYPNADAVDNGYLTFESHVDKSSITDKEFTSSINWAGAELVIRSRRWVLDRNLITSNSGNTIFYTTSSIYKPYDEYGYFIQNNIKTLDKFGEWYYNPSGKKLSIYFGSNNPSSYNVQTTTKDNLVSSGKFGNIVFDNLTIKGANGAGFNIKNGSNITIQNCDVMFTQDGVVVNGYTNFKIQNCTIANSNNNGIKFGHGVNSSTVKNNKIFNTALIAGLISTGDANGLAIYSNGDNNIIEYNEIRNTGHIGISFKGNDVTVKNNFIDSFCLTKDDGSGIYSYTDYVAYTGSKIIGNIVMNGIGAISGTGNSIYSTSGIYLDHNISTIDIVNNTVINCRDYGIYLHNSSNMVIKNNTLFNNGRQQLNITQSSGSRTSIQNNVVNQNILFSRISSQAIMSLKSAKDDVDLFGRFDSNYYVKPLNNRIAIYSSYVKNSGGNIKFSNADPSMTSIDGSVRFECNTTKENKTISLNGNYTDVKKNQYRNTLVLQPYSSIILIKEN